MRARYVIILVISFSANFIVAQSDSIVLSKNFKFNDGIFMHFEDFKNKRYDKILNELNIDRNKLKDIIELIAKLNPKPGVGLYNSIHNYIIPDFIVENVEKEFVVTLNDWNVPPLRISKTYKQLLSAKNKTDKETKLYIRKKIESAKWFISSIYQRKITMLSVMQAIVEKQYDFFAKGPSQIRPLIMREIAEIINMDISKLETGVYIFKLLTEEGLVVKQIVVE